MPELLLQYLCAIVNQHPALKWEAESNGRREEVKVKVAASKPELPELPELASKRELA
jgi:hypothetical protein